jgi:flagellar protein FlaG
MNTNSIDTSGATRSAATVAAEPVRMAAPRNTVQSSSFAQSSQSAQNVDNNADVSPAQAKQFVAEMQKQVDGMNIGLQYSFYGENNRKIAVKVTNKETGEVIREIPPKEMQALQTKIGEMVGKIFNAKA